MVNRKKERQEGGRGKQTEEGEEIVKSLSLSAFVWIFGFFLGMMMISTCQIIQTSELLKLCKLQIIQIHIKIIIIWMNTQYISNDLSNF